MKRSLTKEWNAGIIVINSKVYAPNGAESMGCVVQKIHIGKIEVMDAMVRLVAPGDTNAFTATKFFVTITQDQLVLLKMKFRVKQTASLSIFHQQVPAITQMIRYGVLMSAIIAKLG